MKKAKIAFIGGGNMARSIVAGLIKDAYDPHQIWVADRNLDKCQALEQTYQVHTTSDLSQAITVADIVVLAVKPQNMRSLAVEIGRQIQQQQPLLISVAAGIKLSALQSWFGQATAIVRAMPNMPAILQAGATGLFANEQTSTEQKSLAEQIMRAVGIVLWLKNEKLIDAVASVAGSGPAYYFYIMEIMQNIAEDMELSPEEATLLAKQTIFGAAKLALETNEPISSLRQQVTSKGGSTAAALAVMQKNDLHGIFEKALYASNKRADELAQMFGETKQLDTE